MGFPRQEYWSILPFPSPRDIPDPGIKPRSPALQADSLLSEPPGKPMYIHVLCCVKLLQLCLTLCNPKDCSPPVHGILLCPWDSPGKNIGVGCHALLQGIFLTQGSNPGLLHCRQILYYLNHQGSPLSKATVFQMFEDHMCQSIWRFV